MANLERFVPRRISTETIKKLDFDERYRLAFKEADKAEAHRIAFWMTTGTLSATRLALYLTNIDLPETVEKGGIIAAFGLIGLTGINAIISNSNSKRALK